ncbi:polysaccharide pyruvyl transferase family protein [Parvularcula flava]|uniref:Polysaccharide pyruvyl transferase family protein n=2 Tax=Aquisalinus luteolus TaxID=1566827 RepID=A0ABX0HJW7_9PROT|nr:polysaccharide pyruvyl transferase family protein [Aquisalinus luteolus]NHK26905.1 polysaccharide pyruvyl transferase family protein [Aquisalinus luteolus]
MTMMLERFEYLADRLRALSDGRRLVYIPNPGNYGDGLIRYATKQFLADFGFEHHELNIGYTRARYQLAPWLVKGNACFLYGGGGAWSEHYGFARDYCRFIDRFTDRLMVLPSTYALDGLPKRAVMFRRDEAQSVDFAPNSEFCHDMALYAACRKKGGGRVWPAPTQGTGMFLRTDRESRLSAEAVPGGNVDLSLEGDHMSNGDDFLSRIAAYETVVTDRLHVAIGACIVGRKVRLITGNYFKIRAIYDASLAPHFGDQVSLVEEPMSVNDLASQTLSRAS